MADESEKLDAEIEDAESSGPLAGERLMAARREQKIPILEIAKELHLDEYKVRALERNEFDVIGAPVFAKGHLRKYAQLVGVPQEDVMTDYYVIDRSHGAPPEISLRARPRREISPGPWLAALVVILLLALVYWWISGGTSTVETSATDANIAQSLPGDISGDISDDVSDDESISEDSDAASTGEAEGVVQSASSNAADDNAESQGSSAVVAVNNPPIVSVSSEMRVSITFSGDCWTEITDAGGQRLFFNLGSAGETINLTGDAPFNVLFGNAEFVNLIVDGEPYDIDDSDLRGRTARFTITRP